MSLKTANMEKAVVMTRILKTMALWTSISMQYYTFSSTSQETQPYRIKLLLRHVETLQTELDACQDEDEQCALEEDLTGKVRLVIDCTRVSNRICHVDAACMLVWCPC